MRWCKIATEEFAPGSRNNTAPEHFIGRSIENSNPSKYQWLAIELDRIQHECPESLRDVAKSLIIEHYATL